MLPSVQVYSRKTIQMSNQNHCDGLILFLTNENPRDWHGRLYCVVIEICTCYFVVLPCNKIASANFDKYTIQGWQKSNTTSSEMLQSNRPRCECAHTQEQKKHKEIIKEPAWNNKQRSQQQKLCTVVQDGSPTHRFRWRVFVTALVRINGNSFVISRIFLGHYWMWAICM